MVTSVAKTQSAHLCCHPLFGNQIALPFANEQCGIIALRFHLALGMEEATDV